MSRGRSSRRPEAANSSIRFLKTLPRLDADSEVLLGNDGLFAQCVAQVFGAAEVVDIAKPLVGAVGGWGMLLWSSGNDTCRGGKS